MRVIVAGSRDITSYDVVAKAIELSGFEITTVLSGTARGVDTLGEAWVLRNGIPIEYFSADWDRLGNRAGMVRNAQMADKAEALIAVWDGASKGTHNMIHTADRKGLKVFIHRV